MAVKKVKVKAYTRRLRKPSLNTNTKQPAIPRKPAELKAIEIEEEPYDNNDQSWAVGFVRGRQ